jgi:hypothetical protein
MKPPVTGFILIYLGAVCFGIALGVGYMTIHQKHGCVISLNGSVSGDVVKLIAPLKYKVPEGGAKFE